MGRQTGKRGEVVDNGAFLGTGIANVAASAGSSLNASLLAQFEEAFYLADQMFSILRRAAWYERPISLRHQNIFYLGHLPAFAWNQVFKEVLGRKSIKPEFDLLFERGIDPDDTKLADHVLIDWPALNDIAAYRAWVESQIANLLINEDLTCNSSLRRALEMTLEHYLMHVETFLYMLHQLPYASKIRCGFESFTPAKSISVSPQKITIPAGCTTLGVRDRNSFHWCNEYDAHQVTVPGFQIDRLNVTNAQFMEFVLAGGYQQRQFWDDQGWSWLQAGAISHPHFWRRDGAKWLFKGFFEEVELNMHCPVWVTQCEAAAYASWKGERLPSEWQYHRAAFGGRKNESCFPWGDAAPLPKHGNFGLANLSPLPVGSHTAGQSAFGVQDLVGNGWEWTRSLFGPFDGFQIIDSYPGYSADFFDGRHYVLKGASPLTARRLIRPSFRNWFQAHYPYVYASFRCVSS